MRFLKALPSLLLFTLLPLIAVATLPVYYGSWSPTTGATVSGTAKQVNSATVGLTFRAATSLNTMSDLVDMLGQGSGTCDEPVFLCINPATAQDVTGLKLFNYSATKAGIAVSSRGLGDGIFVGMSSAGAPNAGYGVDVVNYNATNANPELVLNNTDNGGATHSDNVALGLFQSWATTADLFHTNARPSANAWMSLSTDTSTWTGNAIDINAANGSGTFVGNFESYKVNNLPKWKVDFAGHAFSQGTYIPPMYASNGAAINSTVHGVLINASDTLSANCLAGTACAFTGSAGGNLQVTWSGTSFFNAASFSCYEMYTGANNNTFTAAAQSSSGTSMYLLVRNVSGSTVNAGTTVTYTVVCVGT